MSWVALLSSNGIYIRQITMVRLPEQMKIHWLNRGNLLCPACVMGTNAYDYSASSVQ